MDGIELCVRVILTAGLPGWATLVGFLEAHRGQISHALRAHILAIAASPRVIPLLTLAVVE